MFGGCFPAYLEYRYAKSFAIEGGVGYLGKNFRYFFPLDKIIDEDAMFTPGKSGYYLSLENKLGPSFRSFSIFASLGMKYRHFEELSTKEFYTGGGYQWIIGDRFSLDTELNIGMMTQHSYDNKTYVFSTFNNFYPFLTIGIKLGYKF